MKKVFVHVRRMLKDCVACHVKIPTMTCEKITLMAVQSVNVILAVLTIMFVTRHLASVNAKETLTNDSVTVLRWDSISRLFTLSVVRTPMLSPLSRGTRHGQQQFPLCKE